MKRHIVIALVVCLAGNAFGQIVPSGGWTEDATLGSATPGSSVSPTKGTYEVTGNGNDIWDAADAGQYLYKELVGDGSMTTRVVDNGEGSNLWAKGGAMIRQSTETGSQHAFTCITGGEGGGSAFQRRVDAGGSSTSNHPLTDNPYAPPYWVRLERVGNDFTAFLSADGENWAQEGDVMTIAMQDPVLIGLAVTSHAAGELRTFTFDNISFTGEVSGETNPGNASTPSPADEAVDVPRDSMLGWAAGEYPGTHDVYLGTNPDDVNDAGRADAMGVLLSQGQTNAAFDPGILAFDQTYYWRIDEVNSVGGAIFKGDVWSFTVEPLAYVVEGVTATTDAVSEAGAGIENALNGSGLNAAGEHSVEAADMWLGTPSGADPIQIEFELPQSYKLHEMVVWNYNVQFEVMLGFGCKDVTVEYSADGIDWMVLGDVEFAQATAKSDYTANTAIDFGGVAGKYVRLTINSGYGPLGQFGLSEVQFTQVPAHAREPQPADDAANVVVGTTLDWRAGREAVSHEVYLSTDPDALALAGTVDTASFMPSALEFGMDYYWQVVEVNEADEISAWDGPVWSFQTQDYALIEGFESYDDEDDRIYDTWLDGWVNDTGSTVGYLESPFAETSNVNSGSQAMPLAYDNSAAPMYSETEYDLGGMKLNGNGADSLRLFVSGQAPAFAESTDGSIFMNGIGADIWGTADEFRYAYKNLTGDGSMIARVDYLDGTPNAWAKGGVMIRQSAEVGSMHAFAALTGGEGGGAAFQRRIEANGESTSDHGLPEGPYAAPTWVKIERIGNAFSCFFSTDGTTWTQAGDALTIAMQDPVQIGLAVTSHNATVATSAEFSTLSTTGNVSGAWQIGEIGVAQPGAGNDPETVYVAVEDSAGHVAVVTHPSAALRSGWTEWVIPYTDLAGINLGSVKTMYVGVGDRDNPSSGGTGLVLIDDIGYGRPFLAP
jgi:hypothetical protein